MPGIIVIVGTGDTALRVSETINAAFPEAFFIVEERSSRIAGLRRRMRRHGVLKAAGQVLFRAVLARMMKSASNRIEVIWTAAGLARLRIEAARLRPVSDVNGAATHAILGAFAPDLVIVFSTSKLSAPTIAACAAPILNLHPGITPRFRGLHCGYWALRCGDARSFGVTVHRVDAGLDTGPVVDQIICSPHRCDNVATYSVLLCAAGLPPLIRAAAEALEGTLVARPAGPPAPLRHEPTLWDYLAGGVASGVW